MADWKQEAIRLFKELAPLAGFDPEKSSIEMAEDGINIDDWSIDMFDIEGGNPIPAEGPLPPRDMINFVVIRWITTSGTFLDPPDVSEAEEWTVPTAEKAVIAILTNMRKLDWEGKLEDWWMGLIKDEMYVAELDSQEHGYH